MPSSRQALVGVFAAGGLLLFATGLFLIGDRRKLFSKTFEVHAEFSQLSGLQNGARVRVAGMDAGEVLQIAVPPGPASRFRVRARVTENLHPLVRADSVASIQTDGLVGNKFLQIDAGSQQAPAAPPGSTISSREPFDWRELMEQMRDTVMTINAFVKQVDDDIEKVIQNVDETTKNANELIVNVRGDIKSITASGNKIAGDIRVIVDGVRAGRGTAGKLLNDDQLYNRLSKTMRDAEQVAQNAKTTTDTVAKVVSDFQSRGIVEDVETTMKNVRQVSEQVKDAVSRFQARAGTDEGALADLRHTLVNAREAMSDLAENMEALKHNWFFRGFFRRRGFFDLDRVTLEEYRKGRFAEKRARDRAWIHESRLFSKAPDGTETLSKEGKEQLDAAMAKFLPYHRDHFFMVEGYAARREPPEQWLTSFDRAEKVRAYLVRKFRLRPDYVGVMPMGAVRSDGKGEHWEGVSLVVFFEKSD